MSLASLKPVSIADEDFQHMLAFARLLYRLKNNERYTALLADKLPATAAIMPDAPGILMGFDFHLTANGPKLIEINNNAGGLYIGEHGSEHGDIGPWLPQPDIAALSGRLEFRLTAMFPDSWKSIAIVDDDIEQQYMYPEMQAYARLLRSDGRDVCLACPQDIRAERDGLYVNDRRIDGIYNRHTDFYLESPLMRHIRTAYEAGQVQLNPHPRSYALLGDKARMADWWHEGVLESCLDVADIAFIRAIVPEIHLMHEIDPEQAWAERKDWVFKPSARHGGKGVLLGKSMSRKRFELLPPDDTVMQRYVPASMVEIDDVPFKFDVRLYTQGEKLIAVAGRLWQGQVTNFRSEGSGWVPLNIGK